jgi:membrane-bound lytic murein transglycosylase B
VSSEKITYAAYKARLGVDLLKIRGEGFVEKNQDVLAAAQLATEVDQNYLAAIIGIESRFATFTGDHLAANALAALALSTRERMKNLGLNEIRSLLAYCDKHNLRFEREEKGKRQEYTGPFVPSSWAGALGYFQFLPSNLEKLAISAEPGRNPNPFHIPDCLHSIGNYFNKAGWSRKEARSAPAKDSRNWKAIYAYNHSNHYVQAVVEIAEHLRAKQKT